MAILQTIIQEKLQNLIKIWGTGKRLDFKDKKFSVEIRDIQKLEKKIPLVLAFLVTKIRKNMQSMH